MPNSPGHESPGAADAEHYRESKGKPGALACIGCRKRHVRCDGVVPRCTRCQSHDLQCQYQPSRRGLGRRSCFTRPFGRPSQTLAGSSNVAGDEPRPGHLVWHLDDPGHGGSGEPLQVGEAATSWTDKSLDLPTVAGETCVLEMQYGFDTSPAAAEEEVEDDELFVNYYYAKFHAAHPILVPHGLYSAQSYPSYLKLVVHLIGCHFSGTVCSETMQGMAAKALERARGSPHRPHTLVQALLLFSIVLHARCRLERSISYLSQAVSLALRIGMNRSEFATTFGQGSAILEEGLRRTWWELYVTDGFMAALQCKAFFPCNSVAATVCLPCHEYLYTEDTFMIDEPPTLAEFDARAFSDQVSEYSSACYRIDAVRVLAQGLSVAWMSNVHRDQLEAIDNSIAAWLHHLGPGGAEPINDAGEVDGMLFQAHVIREYTTIYVHLPRSDLPRPATAVAGLIPQGRLLPVYSRALHRTKAVEAAKRLGNLFSLPGAVEKQTPFLLEAILLSAAVQLSASSLGSAEVGGHFRDRLRLSTGVLKTLSPVWARARDVLAKVCEMVEEVETTESKGGREMPNQAGTVGDSAVALTASEELSLMDLPWMDIPM